MPLEPFLGFSAMHRLAAKCCPTGDRNWPAQFSRILMFHDVGMLGSDSYDMKILGFVTCYL